MRTNQFQKIADEQLAHCAELLRSKGEEYSKETDRLRSFKKAGALQNETQKQALFGMLAKHLVSVSDMCESKQVEPYDRWIEKISDSINYFVLLRAIVEEEHAGNE